ncbi:hypothetical protein BD779DRAFT_1679667 [Infundibulicybe gibba]|nr:hypothetical protein BD779DRAFT_1679667 [Infundibulicybe gibba]
MVLIQTKNLLIGLMANYMPIPFPPGFDVAKVASLAESTPSHSWEYGTAAQALLELYNPHISVFGAKPFPLPSLDKKDIKAMAYAAQKIVIGKGENALSPGDGAVGDPASLGTSAVLLGKTDKAYADAAAETVRYLLEQAPRYWNGAISQRANTPELWADFMYMAPTFLAFYAADKGDAEMLQESVRQCGHYRHILKAHETPTCAGAWQHIIGNESQDTGSVVDGQCVGSRRDDPRNAIDQLGGWISEIIDGAMAAPLDDGLLRNYLNDLDSNGHGFGEISGSSLLAATVYRMAMLQPHLFGERHLKWADGFRTVLGGKDRHGNPHITDTGIVTPAVNPLAWKDTTPYTRGSPEGQSFVVLMYAAWRDCIVAGICSSGGQTRRMVKHRHRDV